MTRSLIKATLLGLVTVPLVAQPVLAAPREGLRTVVSYNDLCGTQKAQSPALLAAIIAAIAGPLVKAGVGAVGSALQKAGAPDEASVEGHSAVMFYRQMTRTGDTTVALARAQSCIVVAAGAGEGDGPAIDDNSTTAVAFGKKVTPPLAKFLTDNGFRKAPSLLVAGAVELSHDHSAWRFAPEVLYVGSPLTSNSWIRGNGRDLVLTLTISGPGATATDASIATRSIMIGRMFTARPDTDFAVTDLTGLATGWMPLPKPSDAAQDRISAASKRLEDRAAMSAALDQLGKRQTAAAPAARAAFQPQLAKAAAELAQLDKLIAKDSEVLAEVAPITISADIKETRDGNKLVADVGKFLSDNSSDIAKPVSDRIVARLDPEARADTAITAGAAQDKLRVDAITAVAAWQTSKAGGEDAYKQRVAKISAEAACRALELKGFADPVCLELVQ